jgi:aerobic carbon-monoxide dehydrogenase large subunit
MDAKTDGRAAHRPRVEDDILVRGRGRYAADVSMPGQAYACFVRSPHAFARITGIDITAASAAAGVLGVLTATDMAGIGNLGRHPPLLGRGGKPLVRPNGRCTSANRSRSWSPRPSPKRRTPPNW